MAITKNTARQWPLVAVVDFDFNDVGTIGTYPAIDLPGNAIVTGGVLEVVTADAGGGTVAVAVGAVTLLAATASTPASRTFITETPPITTAPTTVDVAVAAFALTTGVYRLTIEYVLAGRANEVQPAAA